MALTASELLERIEWTDLNAEQARAAGGSSGTYPYWYPDEFAKARADRWADVSDVAREVVEHITFTREAKPWRMARYAALANITLWRAEQYDYSRRGAPDGITLSAEAARAMGAREWLLSELRAGDTSRKIALCAGRLKGRDVENRLMWRFRQEALHIARCVHRLEEVS